MTTRDTNDPTLDEHGHPHDHDTIAPDPARARAFVAEQEEARHGDRD